MIAETACRAKARYSKEWKVLESFTCMTKIIIVFLDRVEMLTVIKICILILILVVMQSFLLQRK